MKRKAYLSSMLLGLIFPLNTFANASTQTSISIPNQENFNTLENVEIAQQIAQRYITTTYVSKALYNHPWKTLGVAHNFSGKKVKWKNISVETLNTNRMKLNVYGRVDVSGLRDSNIRVGLFLQRDSYGKFQFYNYDFSVWGGGVPGRVRKEARRRLKNLPTFYPSFQQKLNEILLCQEQRDTGGNLSGCGKPMRLIRIFGREMLIETDY